MDYKKTIVTIARLMEAKGFVNMCGGNISIYDKEAGLLYITPSHMRKADLVEDDIAVLEFDSEKQIAGKKASSEYRLHKAALLARPDAYVCIHCHCTYLTSYAIAREDFVCNAQTSMALVKGLIKCIPYGEPGTTHIADGLVDALAGRDVALLGNHGVVAVSKVSLEECFADLEEMEEVAKTLNALKARGGEPKDIPDVARYYSR